MHKPAEPTPTERQRALHSVYAFLLSLRAENKNGDVHQHLPVGNVKPRRVKEKARELA